MSVSPGCGRVSCGRLSSPIHHFFNQCSVSFVAGFSRHALLKSKVTTYVHPLWAFIGQTVSTHLTNEVPESCDMHTLIGIMSIHNVHVHNVIYWICYPYECQVWSPTLDSSWSLCPYRRSSSLLWSTHSFISLFLHLLVMLSDAASQLILRPVLIQWYCYCVRVFDVVSVLLHCVKTG